MKYTKCAHCGKVMNLGTKYYDIFGYYYYCTKKCLKEMVLLACDEGKIKESDCDLEGGDAEWVHIGMV